MINKLGDLNLNCGIFSVYDFNSLSQTELLCKFFEKINEVVEGFNSIKELTDYLVNEGLEKEVAYKLELWLADGTLENIINEKLFAELNAKINKNTSDIATSNIKILQNQNDIENVKSKLPYVDYERQVVGYGKYKKLYEGSNIFSKQTFGTYEDACVGAFITGENIPVVEILGTNTSGLSKYTNRDSASLYVHNRFKKSNIIKLNGAVYNLDKIILPRTINLNEVVPGMVVDTFESGKQCVGIIKSVNTDTFECGLVDGWYRVDPNADVPVRDLPSSNATFSINDTNKIWGVNSNIFVTEGCPAGCGLEVGVFCSHGNINDVGGIDVVNFENATHYGVKARKGKQSFNNAFISEGNGVAFSSQKASPNDTLISSINSDGSTFSMKNDGLMSKLKVKTQILNTSGTLENDTSVVFVTGADSTISLPTAEVGRIITFIGFGNFKLLSKTGTQIHTPKFSHQEMPVNISSNQLKSFIQLVGDGTSWYCISGSNNVIVN